MQEIFPFLTVFSLGAMICLMAYVLVVNRRSWLGRACFGMCFTFGIWALCNCGIMTTDSEAARVIWFQISSLGWAFCPTAFLLFAMEVSKRGTGTGRRRLIFGTGAVGVVFLVLAVMNPGLFVTRFEPSRIGWGMVKPADSPVLLACLVYMLLSGLVQILWLFQWGRRTTYRQERHLAVMMACAGLFVLMASVVTDIILPLSGISTLPMAPVISLAWFVILAYSALKYHFLDVSRPVAAGEIMTRIRDLVLLLNRDGTIIQMNASARGTLGYGMSGQAGLPLKMILPDVGLPSADMPLEAETEAMTSRGERVPVWVSISSRFNDFNDLIGYIIIAKDIRQHYSLEKHREERHEMKDRLSGQVDTYKTILDHVRIGFLYFGSDQIIAPEYSRQCSVLFGQDDLDGKDFTDMLPIVLDVEEKANIREILDSIFKETRSWWIETFISLLPSRFEYGGRQVALQYDYINAVPGGSGHVMLVILEDRTDKILQETSRIVENTRLSMMVSVLTNLSAFRELLDSYRDYFSKSRRSFMEESILSKEVLYDLYRNVHTFRGNFSRFGMKSTVERLMRIEEQLSGMLALEVTADVIRNLFAQTDPEDWLTQDMDTLKTTLGHDFMQARQSAEPDENLLEEVAMDLEQQARVSGISPDVFRNVLMRLRELHHVHVKQILQDYESYVVAVGRERNLPDPVFVVLGSDAVLDRKQYRAFFRVLIHIFYNIAAHAIETPEERAAMGKPVQARIECRVEAQPEHILIDIADDGCGIDPEQIRGEMQVNEGMTREQTAAIDDRELCQYVFEPGYSSALRADSLPGRGIGLFAVAQAVRQLGGAVSVQSKLGIFTRFSFVLRVRQQTVKPVGKNQYGIAVPAEEDVGKTNGGA